MTGTLRQDPGQDPVAGVVPAVPALARRPVLAIAGGTGAVLLATSGGYGYFGDELYFLAAGRHLSWGWGYADQPPLLPLLAHAIDMVFPGSVVALRFPAVAMMVAGVVVAALIARELGGSSRAQVLTAAAYAIPLNLMLTRMLSTAAVDLLLWTLTSWLVVRWMRLRRDRLLLYAGLVTTVALQAKYLMAVFWLVLAVSALLAGPRELLRRPMLWLGWLVAGAAAVPALLWQAGHGWPQLDMTAAVAADQEYYAGGRPSFLALAVLCAGVPVGAVLFCYGLWRLLRSPDLRPYRFLGWTTVGIIVIFFLANGHNYYVAGLYAVCWAAAAVELERRAVPRLLNWLQTWPAYLVSAVLVLAVALPVRPVSTLGPTDLALRGSVGWPALADTVAAVYRSLPAQERGTATVVAGNYWNAAALDHYGPQRGLPRPYSPHRGYWYLGVPPDDAQVTVFVGEDEAYLHQYFSQVRKAAAVDNPPGIPVLNAGVPIWICTGQHEPWSRLWPQLHDMFGAPVRVVTAPHN